MTARAEENRPDYLSALAPLWPLQRAEALCGSRVIAGLKTVCAGPATLEQWSAGTPCPAIRYGLASLVDLRGHTIIELLPLSVVRFRSSIRGG